MGVGDRQGQVYITKEGFGKSAILPSQDTFAQASKVAQSLMPKQQPKADKASIMKGIRQGKPEWWINHNKDISNEFNNLLDYAADISTRGVDPTKSNDKASMDFQTKFAKLEADAKLSLQKKDQFNAWKTKIDSDPKKYTDASISDGYEHFGKGFDDHKNSGELPPRLVPKDAPYTYSKNLRAGAGKFKITNPGYSPDDVKQNTEIAFADPSQKQGIVDALTPRYNSLVNDPKTGKVDPNKLAALNTQAKNTGFGDPMEMLFHLDFESQLGQEALNVSKLIKGAMPALSVKKKSYEDKENVTRSSRDVWLDPVKAKGAAEMLIDTQPRLLRELQDKGLAQDRISAVDYLAGSMKNFAKEERERATKRDADQDWGGLGYSREVAKADWDIYDQTIRGTLDELPGFGKLNPWQKLLGRKLTAAFAEGAKYKDGVLVLEGKTKDGQAVITGGKGRVINLSDPANAALSVTFDTPNNMGEYPVMFGKTESVASTDEKTGARTTKKTQTTSEPKYLSVTDSGSDDGLKETATQGWYAHGIKNKKELFAEIFKKAIENEEKIRSRNLEAKFSGGMKDKTTTTKKGKYNY